MAKNDNVKDFCKDVADAIRAKKGTTDLINPQDFATEIEGISGGGSGESGGSNWRYWRVDDTAGAFQLLSSMMMVKVKGYPIVEAITGNGDAIMPPAMFSMLDDGITYSAIKAMAADISMKVVLEGLEATIGDTILQNPAFEYLTEITKEQFYDLNA